VRNVALQQAAMLHSGKRGTVPHAERLTQQYCGSGCLACNEQRTPLLDHTLELHAI
jgi:hypothetical protein